MPGTYSKLLYHFIYATKGRIPMIEASWIDRFHAYTAGTVNGLGGQVLQVGGVADHIHVLAALKTTHCVADFLRDLKKDTSKWVHREIRLPGFEWQVGYAALTFGEERLPGLRSYVASQADHHRQESSRDELLRILAACGVEVDMRYFE